MSQYRSAAQHRIETLEARIVAQQAEIDAQRDAIEERDAEIARLRGRGLAAQKALGRSRGVAVLLSSRLVFLAFGVVVGAGATLAHNLPERAPTAPEPPPAAAAAPQNGAPPTRDDRRRAGRQDRGLSEPSPASPSRP